MTAYYFHVVSLFFKISMRFHLFPSCFIVSQNLHSFFMIFSLCSSCFIEFHVSHIFIILISVHHVDPLFIAKLTWRKKAHTVSQSSSRFCNGGGGGGGGLCPPQLPVVVLQSTCTRAFVIMLPLPIMTFHQFPLYLFVIFHYFPHVLPFPYFFPQIVFIFMIFPDFS